MLTESRLERPVLIGVALGGGALLVGALCLWHARSTPVATLPPPSLPMVAHVALPPVPEPKETRSVVKSGDNLTEAVARTGLDAAQTRALVSAILTVRKPHSLRPGQAVSVWRDPAGKVVNAALVASDIDVIDFVPDSTGFTAHPRDVKLVTETSSVSLDIRTSLYDAFIDAHEDPGLAVSVSDVLAWEVDFYRDVQPGDHIDVLVEKTTHDGKLVRYGNIIAVRYTGKIGEKELFRYARHSEVAYYDASGRGARRPFLKQPLPFVHITSRFGGRMHPILGYYKQHQGVDYGAPRGTPVWAVGDGVVEWAGMKGGNGNLVSIHHANGFTSHYAHLSRYGAGVRRGVHVAQKQIIGYVGATGLATGPHLHFALSRGHQFMNPLTQKFPAGEPIPDGERAAYFAAIAPLKTGLGHPTLVAERLVGAH